MKSRLGMKPSLLTPSEHEAALIIHRATLFDKSWVQPLVSAAYMAPIVANVIDHFVYPLGVFPQIIAALLMFASVPILIASHYRNMIRMLARTHHINIPLDRSRLSEQRRVFLFRALIVLLPPALLIWILTTR